MKSIIRERSAPQTESAQTYIHRITDPTGAEPNVKMTLQESLTCMPSADHESGPGYGLAHPSCTDASRQVTSMRKTDFYKKVL